MRCCAGAGADPAVTAQVVGHVAPRAGCQARQLLLGGLCACRLEPSPHGPRIAAHPCCACPDAPDEVAELAGRVHLAAAYVARVRAALKGQLLLEEVEALLAEVGRAEGRVAWAGARHRESRVLWQAGLGFAAPTTSPPPPWPLHPVPLSQVRVLPS